MASMGKLIQEGMEAGWLIATEGVHFGATGIRVQKSADGKVTLTDGPFVETKEVLGGYALLKAASKEEVIELARISSTRLARGPVRFTSFMRCRQENDNCLACPDSQVKARRKSRIQGDWLLWSCSSTALSAASTSTPPPSENAIG